MSGHSKWSTIKRKKGVADQKRGQMFHTLANAITVAVRDGGGVTDPEKNFRVRLAIEHARNANMPNDNIKRAIERAAGKHAENNPERVLYEGFGPGGVGVLVMAVTDNKNRTQAAVRTAFNRSGGTVADNGAVVHMFEHVGMVAIAGTVVSEELLEAVIQVGALDVVEQGSTATIYTKPHQLHAVTNALGNRQYEITQSQLTYRPIRAVETEQMDRLQQLVDALDELDDVHTVITNVAAR